MENGLMEDGLVGWNEKKLNKLWKEGRFLMS